MPRNPRVLFLTGYGPDYLADSLIHGLRTVLGADLVDFPRRDELYRGHNGRNGRAMYGRGFTLYGLLDDIPVDRYGLVSQLRDRRFDLVVFGDIHNSFGSLLDLRPLLRETRVAVLDGIDSPAMYPYSGAYWRRPERWFLPRAHLRYLYFKRELTPETTAYRYFRLLPRIGANLAPPPRNIRPIAFSIPEEKILASPGGGASKSKDLPSHIVDPEVARRVSASRTDYAFESETEYYRDLQHSRFGITTKRAGWDCLRHYEIAANGAVPCFRQLRSKPSTCAPHGLDSTNSISYENADDLFSQLRAIRENDYLRLRENALVWARNNSTVARARGFLAACGLPVNAVHQAAS